MSFGYVVLSVSSSFPAVLPRSSVLAVTSRMSSATWKARPMQSAYVSMAATCSFEAPAQIAPAVTQTFSSAAVL